MDKEDASIALDMLMLFISVLGIIAIAFGFYEAGTNAGLEKRIELLERIIEQHGIVAPDAEVRK